MKCFHAGSGKWHKGAGQRADQERLQVMNGNITTLVTSADKATTELAKATPPVIVPPIEHVTTATSGTVTPESKEATKKKPQGAEAFREDIKVALREACVKTSDDGLRVTYNWTFGRAIGACEKACGIEKDEFTKQSPQWFRKMVQFELDVLKTFCKGEDNEYTHQRTVLSTKLTSDGIIGTKNDHFTKVLSLKQQLDSARRMVDVNGAKTPASQEAAERKEKIQRRIMKEIRYLVEEIDLQNKVLGPQIPVQAKIAADAMQNRQQ